MKKSLFFLIAGMTSLIIGFGCIIAEGLSENSDLCSNSNLNQLVGICKYFAGIAKYFVIAGIIVMVIGVVVEIPKKKGGLTSKTR